MMRKLSPMFVIGLALVLVWCVIALIAPLLATHDPYAIDFTAILKAPSAEHWFGTDNVGRDIYSRVMYGSRLALYIGLLGVIAPMMIGVAVGLLAGYFGGWVETIAMRTVDITVPFPYFVLVLAIVAVLGPGLENYFIALALVGWVGYARLARAEAIVLRQAEFVLAELYHGVFARLYPVAPCAAQFAVAHRGLCHDRYHAGDPVRRGARISGHGRIAARRRMGRNDRRGPDLCVNRLVDQLLPRSGHCGHRGGLCLDRGRAGTDAED